MNEQNRPPQERGGGPPGLTSIFADDDAADVMVTVSSGQNRGQLPVGNSTIGEIRQRFRDRFAIDPQSQAFLDGHEAGEDAVVRAGQVLMFMRRAGEKGCVN